jgi:hypothetical protein
MSKCACSYLGVRGGFLQRAQDFHRGARWIPSGCAKIGELPLGCTILRSARRLVREGVPSFEVHDGAVAVAVVAKDGAVAPGGRAGADPAAYFRVHGRYFEVHGQCAGASKCPSRGEIARSRVGVGVAAYWCGAPGARELTLKCAVLTLRCTAVGRNRPGDRTSQPASLSHMATLAAIRAEGYSMRWRSHPLGSRG